MMPARRDARSTSQSDTGGMKLQATIVISYRTDSLAEAGDKLDDVLMRARERTDVSRLRASSCAHRLARGP
jgi:hypothetical protein